MPLVSPITQRIVGATRTSPASRTVGRILRSGEVLLAGIGNLVAWYRADRGLFDALTGGNNLNITQADGTGIARWEDQSGNGNHLTQATAGQRPLYRFDSGPLSTESVQHIAASSHALFRTGLTKATPVTFIWAVAKPAATGRLLGTGVSAGTSRYLRMNAATQIALYQNTSYVDVVANVATSTLTGVWSRFGGRFISNVLRTMTVNNTASVSNTTDQAQHGNVGGLCVGADWNGGTLFGFMSMDIVEAAFMSVVPTASQLTDLDNYAKARYGL